MDDLLGQIYETIAAPEAWSTVIQAIERRVGASSSWMMQSGADGPAVFVLNGFADTLVPDYLAYYHSVDLSTHLALRKFAGQLPGPFRETDVMDEATWLASEVYNDFALAHDVGCMMTTTLSRITPQAPPALTFFRPPGRPHFDDDALAVYATLLPHLRRATRLRSAMMTSSVADGTVNLTVLEQMRHASFLLGGFGQVLHANAAGRTLLEGRRGLFLVQNGRLSTPNRAQVTGLAVLVARCLERQPRGGELLLRRENEPPLLLTATPLPTHAADPTRDGQCRALIVAMALGTVVPTATSRLSALFGLSAAEARVAAGIATGLDPAEIAAAHQVALSTVRSQLAACYQKLQVRRQAELVRVVAMVTG